MNFKKIIKNIVGEIYYNGYYKYIKPKGNRILIYHAFGSKLKHDSYGISINPKLFEEHLKFLKNNYKLLPLNHDTLDNKLDIDSVTITIDDGYKDNLVAVELMEKYHNSLENAVISGIQRRIDILQHDINNQQITKTINKI